RAAPPAASARERIGAADAGRQDPHCVSFAAPASRSAAVVAHERGMARERDGAGDSRDSRRAAALFRSRCRELLRALGNFARRLGIAARGLRRIDRQPDRIDGAKRSARTGDCAVNYRIRHTTVYDYSDPVTVSHHAARLTPRITRGQTFEDFTIVIEPEPTLRKMRLDYFGNGVCFFSIQAIHQRLEVTSTSVVVMSAETPVATSLSPPWESVARLFRDPVSPDVLEPFQFVFDSPLLCASPELAGYAAPSFTPGRPLLVAVAELTQRIFADFRYDPVATTVATPPAEVFAARHG